MGDGFGYTISFDSGITQIVVDAAGTRTFTSSPAILDAMEEGFSHTASSATITVTLADGYEIDEAIITDTEYGHASATVSDNVVTVTQTSYSAPWDFTLSITTKVASSSPDYSKVKKVNITDKDGNEFSFDVGGGGATGYEYISNTQVDFNNLDKTKTYTITLDCVPTESCTTYHNGTQWVMLVNDVEKKAALGCDNEHSVAFCDNYFSICGRSDGDFMHSINTVTITDGTTIYTYNGAIETYQCFIAGTRITLADGTTKPIEDITYDDMLLTWNFDYGDYEYRKPCWIMKEQTADRYWKVTLSDGTVLGLVGHTGKSHRLYNANHGKFMYPQDFAADDAAIVQFCDTDVVNVVSCEEVHEPVKYYNLMTDHNINCFANGVLTGNRLCNIYPINEYMQFVKVNKMVASREDYADIPDELFYGLRLAEQPVDASKDGVKVYDTISDYVKNCMRLMK